MFISASQKPDASAGMELKFYFFENMSLHLY